jgi:hypothetical protein
MMDDDSPLTSSGDLVVGNFLFQTNLSSPAEDFSFDDPVVSLGHAGPFFFNLNCNAPCSVTLGNLLLAVG